MKILDFGLARDTQPVGGAGSGAATLSQMTAPGALVGTVDYMSPEQVRGEAAEARSDVFALGVVLHEMLTGKRPFDRPTAAETVAAILKDAAPALPPEVPVALARLVSRCLEKDPGRRTLSARDVAAELRGLPALPPRRRRSTPSACCRSPTSVLHATRSTSATAWPRS